MIFGPNPCTSVIQVVFRTVSDFPAGLSRSFRPLVEGQLMYSGIFSELVPPVLSTAYYYVIIIVGCTSIVLHLLFILIIILLYLSRN